MNIEEIKKDMKNIIAEIYKCDDAYYNGKGELLSDFEYDALRLKLEVLETESGIILDNSPTNKVSEDTIEGVKEKHEFPALSLDKSKSIEKLIKWAEGRPCHLSWKLDGCTLVATYDNGKLTKLVTRGNGIIGTNITHLASAIRNVLPEIPYKGHVVIRGEALISYSDFNNYIERTGLNFKNPRNLASGCFSLKDLEVIKERSLAWLPFTLVYIDNYDSLFDSWLYRMNWLVGQGFTTVDHWPAGTSNEIKDVIAYMSKLVDDHKQNLPVDGIVICYEDVPYSHTGSSTGRHFTRAGFALKWEDEIAETELDHIEWSCGKLYITPVAVFNPVELEGTTVQRASLCNISECRRLKIGSKGSKLSIIKANKIIPKVVKVNETVGKLEIPEVCPICGSPTSIKVSADSECEVLVCTNNDCAAKKLKKFSHFCERDCMNIDGMSEQTIDKLINAGFLTQFCDFYELHNHYDEIAAMEGFGKKSATKMIEAIEKSKNTDFVSFIHAVSIPNIGKGQAKLLNKYFNGNIQTFFNTVYDKNEDGYDFTVIEGFGEVLNHSLNVWLHKYISNGTINFNADAEIVNLIPYLTFKTENAAVPNNANLLSGKTFVITGSINHYKNREELQEFIESLGGKASGSVSAKTSYLINNDVTSESGKNKKAKELGIPIISEDDFLEMIK